MRYMLIAKADANVLAGNPPDPRVMAAIDQLGAELSRDGVLVDAGGMTPGTPGARYLPDTTTEGPRLRLAGGRVSRTDGPFTEAKELVGGYALVQVDSEAEAVALGTRFLELHATLLGASYEADSEIRRIVEPS